MKSCVLFSGGWDSVAVALGSEPGADLLFFNYGQTYLENEIVSAQRYANYFGRELVIKPLPLEHDQERRNMYLIAEAKRLGYNRVYSGSRNVLPWFDKYRDSNWLSLKIFGWLMNVDVKLPITGWGKRKIVRYVQKSYSGRPYNCYNNSKNFKTCPCVNCVEMRSII